MSSMSTFAHSSSSSCSHSTPLTLTSSSLTNYSPKTNLTVHVADQQTLCPDSTKRGLLLLWPPQVMRPTWLTLLTSSRLFPTLFQSSNIETVRDLGDNDAASPNAEIDDEHIGNAPASPLFSRECEAEADLRHTYHSNEKRFVSRCTVNLSKHGATRRLADTRTKVEAKTWMMKESGSLWKRKRSNCSRKQNPKSWKTRTQRILPKITLVN